MHGDTLLCDDSYEPDLNLTGSTSEKQVKTLQIYGDTLKLVISPIIQFPYSITQVYSIGLMVRYAGSIPPSL